MEVEAMKYTQTRDGAKRKKYQQIKKFREDTRRVIWLTWQKSIGESTCYARKGPALHNTPVHQRLYVAGIDSLEHSSCN